MFKKLIYLTSFVLVLSLAGEGWPKASNPDPRDGALFPDILVTLSWRAGDHAVSFDIYVGDNYDDVKNGTGGTFRVNQSSMIFIAGFPGYPYPDGLVPGTTYYWRIDEINDRHPDGPWVGDVWSFTVGDGAPPDGVEGNIYVDAVNGNDNNSGLTPRSAFVTIKKGIDEAADGDVVLVYPGLYLGEINFLGKTLTVQGVAESPAGVPVLWNPDDFAVSFYYGEGPGSILKNFIIRDSFMGVFIADSSPTISNLTIVGNKYGIEAYANSEPDISNIILWDNTDGDLFGCRARYSCVERGGEGNITDDPLFVDPDNDDFHIRSWRGRYWPEHDIWVLDKVTSPCVDGGDPKDEALNEPMPNGGRINIGAYGGTTEASLSPNEEPYFISRKASNPYPADRALDVDRNATLTWTAGLNAVSHDVYVGADIELVFYADTSDTRGTYRGRQAATSYTPPEGFGPYRSWYWRIDQIDSQGNRTKGDFWTFTIINPPPKGRTCFTAETKVWTNSALIPISKIGLGQSIRGMNCLSKIQEVQEHKGTFTCYDVLLESGNCIGVAENHYFLAESGQWISLLNLKAGIKLQTPKGSIKIISITKRPILYTGKVYNLKVKGSDRYLVGKDAVIVRDY